MVSLLFVKDYHSESKPGSRLFKADKNKIFEMHEWAKKLIFLFFSKNYQKLRISKNGQIWSNLLILETFYG